MIIGLWALSGFAFWMDGFRVSGRPERWAECVFVHLPASLIGGPLWWVALVVFRRK
jgi:hypothetical protein